MKLYVYQILILLFPTACFAQVTISGRIIGQADTRPVANASVFLNNATSGTKTAEDGTFTLKGIKAGKYELVVSIIGFDNYNQQITVNQDNLDLHDITIYSKTIALNEVKIKPKDESGREIYLGLFKQYFLGTSGLAESCDIINPLALYLDYDEDTKTLTASANDFLEIKNQALGYKVKYLLKEFTLNRVANEIHYEGPALFEPMQGSPSQQKRWVKNREEVYDNSSMHFLRSLAADDFSDEGFQVQLVTGAAGAAQTLITTPLSQADFFKRTDQKGVYDLYCASGSLFVSYSKNHRFNLKTALARINDPTNRNSTLVAFNSPNSLFQGSGVLLNPGNVVFSGAWGNNRVAELLPSDYEPPVSEISSTDSLSLKTIEGKTAKYYATRPVEKVYLHLDKQVYFPGDTIWYKAYTVNRQHQLSLTSSVLYVELTGPNDSVINRQTLNLLSGTSGGEIALPVKPVAGAYYLRAYTNWMRNGSPADIYNHKLLIAGNVANLSPPRVTSSADPDVQFFPEGGNLVNGLRCRVAVKCLTANGLGIDASGTITDGEGNPVAEFKTQHLGMGVFAFTPQAGKTYRAKIQMAGEPGISVELPKAVVSGCAITLNNSGSDSVYVKVAANEELLKAGINSPFYLVAQSGGKIYYTSAGKLTAKPSLFALEKSRFPSGIVQFTLFSAQMETTNERIVFIERYDTLKLKLDSIGLTATVKQKMRPQFVAVDNGNTAVTGTFSVSVTNENIAGTDEPAEQTIFNNLLLTSELKGYIENPNYYFINPGAQTRADLDVLMLTQGYRRYEWKQILEKNLAPPAFQPEKTLSLTGIVKTTAGKPVVNQKVIMAVSKLGFFKDTVTDAKGLFTFRNLDLPDSAKVLFNAGEHNEVTVFPKKFLPGSSTAPTSPAPASPEIEQLLASEQGSYLQLAANDSVGHVHMLKEITVKEYKGRKEPDLTGTSNLNGPGHADQVIMDDQLDNCISLADCLNGKLHFIYENGGIFFAQRYQNFINVNSSATILPSMVIIVDGSVMDSSYIGEVNAKDVKSVEVLISGGYLAIYGTSAPFGALIITTKRGPSVDSSTMVSNLSKYIFNGFSRGRVFYSPKYDHQETATARKDLRSTVYWEPYLITGKNGKASFDFYNAEAKGVYKIVVEGIDITGRLGRLVYRYRVE